MPDPLNRCFLVCDGDDEIGYYRTEEARDRALMPLDQPNSLELFPDERIVCEDDLN